MTDIINNKYFRKNFIISIIIIYCISLYLDAGLVDVLTSTNRVFLRFVFEASFCFFSIVFILIYKKICKKEIPLFCILMLLTVTTGFHLLFSWSLMYFVLKKEEQNDIILTVIFSQLFLFIFNTMYLGGFFEVFKGDGRLFLGFTNPNRASMHIISIIIFSLYYFRNNKYVFLLYMIGLYIVFELKEYTGTKTMIPVYICLLPTMIPEKFYSLLIGKIMTTKSILNKVKFLIYAIPAAIISLPFLVATIFYNNEINEYLTRRPSLWKSALYEQTNYLFGELNIFELTQGTQKMLDSDYINIFYIGGFIFLLFFVVVLVGLIRSMIKNFYYKECLFVFGVLVYGLTERNMILSPSLVLIILPFYWYMNDEVE